jgi:hypothetical protein
LLSAAHRRVHLFGSAFALSEQASKLSLELPIRFAVAGIVLQRGEMELRFATADAAMIAAARTAKIRIPWI